MPLGISKLNTLSRISVPTRTAITCTAGGNAKITTVRAKFGQSSAVFDGADDFITANLDSNNLVTNFFESGQVGTIEVWLYIVSMPSGSSPNQRSSLFGRFGTGENGWAVDLTTTGNIFLEDDTAGPTLTLSSAFTTGSWQHLAIVNNGSGLTIYRNGTQVATNANIATNNATTNFRIGNRSIAPALNYNGYMDEFRISNIARYTGNFTPSDSPFTNDENTVLLLHFENFDQSTSIIDDAGQTITVSARPAKTITASNQAQISTAQSKIGSSSVVFDGSSDYLTVSTMPAVTGDVTIELWARFDILPKNQTLGGGSYMMLYHATTEPYFLVSNNTSNNPLVSFGIAAGYFDFIHTGKTIAVDTWYHIAIVRNNGTWRVYWDGSDTGSSTTLRGTNDVFESSIMIGKFSDTRGSWDGYMDEFRISNIARYTSNFTPSTTPFTNDANTLLLMHFEGSNGSTTFTDDNS